MNSNNLCNSSCSTAVAVTLRSRFIPLFNATSTSPRLTFETGLRPGAPSVISYRRLWRKLFGGKIFIGSQRHNRETVSHDLRSEERRVGKECRSGWQTDH